MAKLVLTSRRISSALCAFFFAAVALSACGGGVPGDSVAQVGNMSITSKTFTHWMSVAAASSQQTTAGAPKPAIPVPPNFTACIAQLRATTPKPAAGQAAPTDAQFKAQCQQEYTSLQSQVLQFLISADWVLGESSSQGIKVADSAVQKQFNTIKSTQFTQPGAFQQFLAQSGQTQGDLLLRVKLDLLSTQLRNKVTNGKGTVTNAQVASYYQQNMSRFAQPERRDIRLILTKTQAQAAAAKKQIQSGQSFAAVAKKVSIDQASKAQGGALLGVVRGQQEQALDAAIFSAKVGVLSGPVKTPFGYYIFQVQKDTPATQQTLAQASPTIKQQLSAQQQQTALTNFVTNFRKRWTAKTDCKAGYVVQDCKQYKAPKTSTVPGATTTVPQTTAPQTTTPQTTTTGK